MVEILTSAAAGYFVLENKFGRKTHLIAAETKKRRKARGSQLPATEVQGDISTLRLFRGHFVGLHEFRGLNP